MASIWIRRSDSLSYSSNALTNFQINSLFARKVKANFSSFLVIILLIHFAAGIHRVSLDVVYPYSASKEVAKFIRNSEYSNWPLFGTRDVEVASVSGYLGTSIYYPELEREVLMLSGAIAIQVYAGMTLLFTLKITWKNIKMLTQCLRL